jgi:hypothetical protein
MSHYNKKITPFGYLIFAIMIIVMLGIFSLKFTAPTSTIGKLVSTDKGSILVAVIIAIVFAVLGYFLRKFGLKVLENKKDV